MGKWRIVYDETFTSGWKKKQAAWQAAIEWKLIAKDDKLKFLTMLITLTELVIGEELDVKPAKIVTGQDPDKTNIFLQAMA